MSAISMSKLFKSNDIYVLPDIDIIIENENIQIVPINQPNVMVMTISIKVLEITKI